ncbi:MAG TPA: hypothetical protein VJ836_05310 [Candidatus Saccharimonadales bacterium]|nr:hypothetical protein [Candidatus Saccharimonadales bacterium]
MTRTITLQDGSTPHCGGKATQFAIIEQRFDPASPEGAEQVRELFDDMAPRHGIPEAIITAVQASQHS